MVTVVQKIEGAQKFERSQISMAFAALFDCDGVIIDTESQYSDFWKTQNELYLPDDPNMYIKIKGSTLKQIFDRYFKGMTDTQEEITKSLNKFERSMTFSYIPGVVDFIKHLRARGVKTALVTSSNDEKMAQVYEQHPEFKSFFDVMITADKVTKSKPDPQCYLKAASELGIGSEKCFVFEDSFAGLEAGMSAKMKVIGLATTNPEEAITNKCHHVIPDFTSFGYEEMVSIKE